MEFLTYVLGDVELEEDGSFSDPEDSSQLVEQVKRAKLMSGPAGKICGELFDCLDVDGSGTLEPPEVRRFLQMSGTPDDELDYYLADALRVADKNQVGS